jgi:hypothetical protein
MRIRWTTRIAMAAGMITLIAGIVAGGGTASAAPAHSAPTFSQTAATP